MFELSLQTNHNLIELISKTKNLKIVLIERFLSFLNQILKSLKIDFINEITNVKFNQPDVEQFSREELDEILNFLCTS